MNIKKYKYSRSGFESLPVKLEHMDIFLNFLPENRVEGANVLRMTAVDALDSITLDARDLDIEAVELLDADGGLGRAVEFDYLEQKNQLVVKLPELVEAGTTFSVKINAVCVPSDSILEGIYKDTTPDGCPQQYMSQCQQWGFQRILPIFDDCTAKCTMTTVIEADARYTHLISNGNICRVSNPDGVPVVKKDDSSRQVIKYINDIPMAPYLFLITVGTWDVVADEVTYPSGRKVGLEYLVPPGRKSGAEIPMQILKDSVLWQGESEEYEYLRDVYRTICMEKSNFGGMENVGNTTIVTSAALIDEWTGDTRLKYAYGIIIHEFEHNQCGSDVTMETPFDMWLNEAFTVDVERRYEMNQFDPDCTRLDQVGSIRAPIGGPLAIEDGGHMGNIVREGFNDPDEVVDGVTYVKAAEVIRMLRLVLGADVFIKCKTLYFERYDGGNANTDQFFACFEEVSGRDLSQFKQEWLHTIGYPQVTASHVYDEEAKELHVSLKQTRAGTGGLFHLPIDIAAVGADGSDIKGTAQVVEMTGESLDLSFKDIPEPAFVSCNRNSSFYGTFEDVSADRDALVKQIRLDSNLFNRVEAMRRFTDIERIKLINEPGAEVSSDWLDVYSSIVGDMTLPAGLKGYLLKIDEQSVNRDYLPMYRERYSARKTLLKAVADNCMDGLLEAWDAVDTYTKGKEPADGIEERQLKAVLLRSIVEGRTPDVYDLAGRHFDAAWNISDRIATLSCINVCGHPDRKKFLASAFEEWKDHLTAYTSYLVLISSGVEEDVFDMIREEEQRDTFQLEHPGHNRALFLPMGSNNSMLWTDKGINWTADTAIRLAGINENTTLRVIGCFGQVAKLGDDLKPKVVSALEKILDAIDNSVSPSVVGRLEAYLGKG